MFARCQRLGQEHLQPKVFSMTIQNKIGNARQKVKPSKDKKLKKLRTMEEL